MIKIKISEKQKMEIEKIYWDWFKKNHLKNFKAILNKNQNFKNFIVKNNANVDESIRSFLISSSRELENIKNSVSNYEFHLNVEEKKFFLDKYKDFRSTQAGKIYDILNLRTCPYCNQNFLNIVINQKGEIKYRGQLDHFYPKSKYPYFAICLYNMIPACSLCNNIKGSEDLKIKNPYDVDYESKIKFKTEFDKNSDLSYLNGKSDNFNIIIDKSKLTVEDENEISMFELEERYKNLKRNTREIIFKINAYDKKYIDMLKNKFCMDVEILKEYIFGLCENDSERILSKFNKDILEEFYD